MPSKTISVSEDAYDLLSKMKLKNESFTETIKRLAKRRKLTDCAGLWSDATDEEMKEYWNSITELRDKARESLEPYTVEDS
jgi:predicted CopG family antitoxin